MSIEEQISTSSNRKVLEIRPTDRCRTYGVMIRFDDKTRIHYETEVSLWPGEEGFLFQVDRRQVYINDHAPDLIIDKLADDLGKVLYPLRLHTDHQGKLLGIANGEALRQRWQQQKDLLLQYYKGDLVDKAILEMDQVLKQEKSILLRLKDDWFYSLFFSGIYGLRAYDFREKTIMALPVIPFGPPLQYAVTREITEQHTETKCLVIECKGSLEEQRSAEDIALKHQIPVYKLMNGKATEAEGEVKIAYRLYHKDFSIRSVTGESSFKDPDQGWRNVRFELYHLPDKDKPQEHYRQNDSRNKKM
ncbi:hypothetical protein [Taibaiella koreensis]|uniref:hypothetical protein n=1 Tax=Taibaiella koreensis TaxID=1268548 RepID=UPI000E59A62D|nr:hypothetical protein [Taibaiella koreensis]